MRHLSRFKVNAHTRVRLKGCGARIQITLAECVRADVAYKDKQEVMNYNGLQTAL